MILAQAIIAFLAFLFILKYVKEAIKATQSELDFEEIKLFNTDVLMSELDSPNQAIYDHISDGFEDSIS